MMMKRIFAIALFLLCTSPGLTNEALESWVQSDLDLRMRGTGLESGRVLSLSVVNNGRKSKKFHLPRFTVLVPDSDQYSPVLLESKGSWKLGPGGRLKATLRGYSLDHAKRIPKRNQQVAYRAISGGARYAKVQRALRVGLDVEKEEVFESVFLPEKTHRTLVHQRVLWRVFGGNNPKDAKRLVADLKRSFEKSGKTVSEKSVKAIAASVWRDVEVVARRLEKN